MLPVSMEPWTRSTSFLTVKTCAASKVEGLQAFLLSMCCSKQVPTKCIKCVIHTNEHEVLLPGVPVYTVIKFFCCGQT